MSGTRPDGPGTAAETRAAWLPRRALVLGLARSGRAAALALARRGVEVVAADRSPDADPGRLAEAGVEVRLGSEEESLLDGVELVVKSPGVPAESPLAVAARASRRADLERGRARLPAPREQPADRRHRDERQDDDDRAARRDPPRRRARRRDGGERRPPAHRRRRGDRARHVGRLRAVELPARGRAHVRVRRRRPAQPRAGPPRPPRHLRRVPRREAPHLRARADARSSRAASGSTGSSSPPTTRCRPSR